MPRTELPLVIPMRTGGLPKGAILNVPWAGVGLHQLLTRNRIGPVQARSPVGDPDRFREWLRIPRSTRCIAVLNADDDTLERFWGMNRLGLSRGLHSADLEIVTGPTFSIATETPERPAYHNMVMLGRHHRCWQELDDQGLAVAPNLYWRGATERRQWSEFLRDRAGISVVSREFGAVRRWRRRSRQDIEDLLRLLTDVGRPMHVLLIGVGSKSGPRILKGLRDIGCSGSILTPRPAILAYHRRLLVPAQGGLREVPSKRPVQPLLESNLRALERHLLKSV